MKSKEDIINLIKKSTILVDFSLHKKGNKI